MQEILKIIKNRINFKSRHNITNKYISTQDKIENKIVNKP